MNDQVLTLYFWSFPFFFLNFSLEFFIDKLYPRADTPAKKPSVPRNASNFMEAVFRTGNFSDFSGAFRPEPVIFPELSSRLRSFLEVGMIVLENSWKLWRFFDSQHHRFHTNIQQMVWLFQNLRNVHYLDIELIYWLEFLYYHLKISDL